MKIQRERIEGRQNKWDPNNWDQYTKKKRFGAGVLRGDPSPPASGPFGPRKWRFQLLAIGVLVLALSMIFCLSARASIAFGSINNFDVVNDTGVVCHGFEIELDGIRSKDITYTYDWNHYGVPLINEDISDPLNPRVFVRYQSAKNPDGSWVAFTAIPAGPISPTDGHQFTNPSVNFGGEHFGVGFYGTPSAITYHWLVDNGAGVLVFGGAVSIATPTFTYFPPVNVVLAQVQAVIVPPPPPAPPVLEFGEASWVKETRTASHNNGKVELRDLVSDDPNDPNDRNWTNGEPDEVEVEWQLLQTDFNAGNGGANGELVGAPEGLPNGDEVITRRYDFYKYIGPIDAETGEALADSVGPDGIHGVGIKNIGGVDVDLSTLEVVGAYIGAQMAGFDPAGQIGLIDHLQDGEINVPYVERTMVIGGTPPIVTERIGALPDGMSFDVVTGVLSGTPTSAGSFTFTVHSTDASAKGGDVSNTYVLTIVEPGVVQQPHLTVTTVASPPEGGSTSGGGEYVNGALVTVVASENPGFVFVNWTDGGTVVSTSLSYQFVDVVNRKLVANFLRTYTVNPQSVPVEGGNTSGGGVYKSGDTVALFATAAPGYSFVNWTDGGVVVRTSPSYTFVVDMDREPVANFVRTSYTISVSASPANGGSVSGGGVIYSGDPLTVVATANAGYQFVNWTEGGAIVSGLAGYSFTAEGDRTLTANFARVVPVAAIREFLIGSPIIGGLKSLGTIVLECRAPEGGVLVELVSSDPGVLRVPLSLFIQEGQRCAFFKVDTSRVRDATTVSVTAKLGDSERSRLVKILPRKIHVERGHRDPQD